jgi:hypothetical protein
MAENTHHNDETISEEVAQNTGLRTAAINSDPNISNEEARNAAAGSGPNASGGTAPSTAEDRVPSRSDPYPSNLPSYDHPLPDDADEQPIGSNEKDEQYAH